MILREELFNEGGVITLFKVFALNFRVLYWVCWVLLYCKWKSKMEGRMGWWIRIWGEIWSKYVWNQDVRLRWCYEENYWVFVFVWNICVFHMFLSLWSSSLIFFSDPFISLDGIYMYVWCLDLIVWRVHSFNFCLKFASGPCMYDLMMLGMIDEGWHL